jgi:hypothetical protein
MHSSCVQNKSVIPLMKILGNINLIDHLYKEPTEVSWGHPAAGFLSIFTTDSGGLLTPQTSGVEGMYQSACRKKTGSHVQLNLIEL